MVERRGRSPVSEVLTDAGVRERFDAARLAASIHQAAASVGEGEMLLAEELAALVALVLEEETGGCIPTTRTVRETVERVLMETGHHEAARSYILRRARIGMKPEPAPATPAHGDAEPARVASLGRECLEPFAAEPIASSLMVDCGLANADARAIASAVERKVRSSGGRVVATATLRQLVASELFERMRGDLLPRVQGLGLPAPEIEAIALARSSPERVATRLGGELLRRYSLARLLDPPVAESHLNGELHVDGLSAPGQALDATLDFAQVRRAQWPGALAALLQLAHVVAPSLHGTLTLQHVEQPLAAAFEDVARAEEAARTLLLALATGPAGSGRHGSAGQLGRPRRVLAVGADLPAAAAALHFRRGSEPAAIRARLQAFVIQLLEQATQLAAHLDLPRVRILVAAGDEERELLHLAAALQPALALGVADVDHAPASTTAVKVVGARVGLNVARLGLLAGRRRERELLGSLGELVGRGLSAGANVLRHLLQRDELGLGFLRRLRDVARDVGRELPLDLPGSHAYQLVLVPVGIDAAVRAVTEREPSESESAARLRADLIGAMRAVMPAGAAAATRFELVEQAFPAAELRFGRLDWLAFPRGRDVLGLAHDGAAFRYSFDPAPPAMAMAAAVAGPSRRVSRPSADDEVP